MTKTTVEQLHALLTVADTPPRVEDDVLQEMLVQVRDVFDVDTAAILLHEPGSDELTARAACGLEEEVRQGVKVLIGTGFAGAVAASRNPVFLDRVDASTVANPILWEKGIKTMLGVPLLSHGDLLGVMHVGRLNQRRFTDDDAELLQAAAERVVASIETERIKAEAAAARLLERSLLPARLPRLPQIRFAARYVPAEQQAIGGDWYDVFTTPSQALWVVIGDVAGHGLEAAVVMGRVKSALRAYTLQSDRPEEVLELTGRKVRHFEIGSMVTVACAVAHPPYHRFALSTAGHPPPVFARPGQESTLLAPYADPPLGVRASAPRSSLDVELPPGGALIFYTDGLVERRDQELSEGMERLRATVRADSAEAVCRDVMHELVGNTAPTDDIALLTVQREP